MPSVSVRQLDRLVPSLERLLNALEREADRGVRAAGLVQEHPRDLRSLEGGRGLLAAVELPKIFPLMMTAAGTLTAARVFIIGVGVAGLSAIATARRLGAIVRAYDVRPACREQVESLGAKFVELPLETAGAAFRNLPAP